MTGKRIFGALDIKSDIRASIVVFLVALPLGMGISIASGYPPIAGIITGIIGGVIIGAISGAPLQVSGAAAGLSVIVFQGVQQFGIQRMGLVILLAGLFQVGAALSGLGRWFQAVSPTVLYGMLAAIGVLIVASQFHVMLDLAPRGTGLQNMKSIPDALQSVFASENYSGIFALGIGLLSLAIMFLWPAIAKGRLKILPAQLVVVVVASVVAALGGFSVNLVKIPSDLLTTWSFGSINFMYLFEDLSLLSAALQLALIASAESLLSAAAVDQMHSGPRAKLNKELAAQGVGNMLCGVVGVLPMTGVIVRSSANVQAGATSRYSTIFHGCWLLLFVITFPQVLAFIPISALAGILVYAGIKLVNVNEIKLLYRYGRSELFIYCLTLAVVVAYDLLFGVILGLAISSVKLLKQLSHLSVAIKHESMKTMIELRGAATFLRLPKLVTVLDSVPAGANVNVKSDLRMVDPACFEHFSRWKKRHEETGGSVEVHGRPLHA